MLEKLEESRRALVESLAGVTDEQSRHVPGAGKWSILEIVEHLAVSEAGMFSGFATARPVEESLKNPDKAQAIFEKVSCGEPALQAPDRARPTGRFPDLKQALAAFEANRDKAIDYARENESKLDFITLKHPLAGIVNGSEMLMIMAGHAVRHAKQIWAARS